MDLTCTWCGTRTAVGPDALVGGFECPVCRGLLGPAAGVRPPALTEDQVLAIVGRRYRRASLTEEEVLLIVGEPAGQPAPAPAAG